MHKVFISTFKSQVDFYKSSKTFDIAIVFFLNIFIGWNGIQFLLYPSHLYLFINSHSLQQNYHAITMIQQYFIPLFIYITISCFILFTIFKVYSEISFQNMIQRQRLSFKRKFNLLINFTVPAFLHNIGVVFVLASVYLLFVIVFSILIVLDIVVNINQIEIMRISLLYFAVGLILFNMILHDFVLMDMTRSNSFSISLKKFYAFFQQNKLNMYFFYSLKFCLMGLCTLLFVYFLVFIFSTQIIQIPFASDLYTSLVATTKLIFAILLSLSMYAIILQFLNTYCYLMLKDLFSDYEHFTLVDERK